MSTRLHDLDLDQLLLPVNGLVELPETLRIKIINGLWNQQISISDLLPYSAYFEYFSFECSNWRASGATIAIQTYRDLLDLAEHLKSNSMEPRVSPKILAFFPPLPTEVVPPSPHTLTPTLDEMLLPLASRHIHCDEESIRNSIDLTVRLWLMINVGSQNTKILAGRPYVKWSVTESLEHLIATSFPLPQPADKQERVGRQQWPKSFNACNLARVGGFEIAWTSNLADHLYYDQDLERISLYHHACVLQTSKSVPSPDQVLPDELLNETMLTLALLLPRANRECRRWYEKAQKRYPGMLDLEAGNQELGYQGRALGKYRYWNERLSIIQKAYDESEPKNVSQWWVDRRKKVQWYTFWIAAMVLLLTIIFGLIQSITGILQVYVAYHSQTHSGPGV